MLTPIHMHHNLPHLGPPVSTFPRSARLSATSHMHRQHSTTNSSPISYILSLPHLQYQDTKRRRPRRRDEEQTADELCHHLHALKLTEVEPHGFPKSFILNLMKVPGVDLLHKKPEDKLLSKEVLRNMLSLAAHEAHPIPHPQELHGLSQ